MADEHDNVTDGDHAEVKKSLKGIMDPSSAEVPGYKPPAFAWARRLIFRLMLLVLISVIPLVALFLLTNLETRSRELDSTADEMERLSRVISSRVEQRFAAARSVLENIAASPDSVGSAESQLRLVRSVLAGNANFLDLRITGTDGRLVVTALATAESALLADETAIKRASASKGFAAGDFRADPAEKRLLVDVALPANGGLVAGTLDLSDLNEFQRTFQLPADSTIHVVDARGNVIARFPGLGPEHTGKPHPLPSLSRGAAGGDVTARAAAGHGGVRRLYGHAPLETGGPAKGNMVVLGIPEATVLGPIEDSLRQNLIWTTVVAVLALIIARWLGQQMIVERVNALILAMRRVALTELRDFHARGRVCQDPSELGDLERSFDIMAHALESRVNELDIREHAIEEAEHANDEDPAAEG